MKIFETLFLLFSLIVFLHPSPAFSECDINFIQGELHDFGDSPNHLQTADFNGDGFKDVVFISGSSQGVYVALSNGDGSLRPAVFTTAVFPENQFSTGYVNSDAFVDLLIPFGDAAPIVLVLLSNGDGTFYESYSYGQLTIRATSTTVVDANNDGINDLVSVGEKNLDWGLQVSPGLGDGTFATFGQFFEFDSVARPFFITKGLFNTDSIPDLLITFPPFHGASIFSGTGNGTFSEVGALPIPSSSLPIDFAIADLNGNGRADVMVGTDDKVVRTMASNPDGIFHYVSQYYFGSPEIDSVEAADFNCDNVPDMAVGSRTSVVKLRLNDGDGNFSTALQVPVGTGGNLTGMSTGDFNGDGREDIVIGLEQGMRVLLAEPSFVAGNPIEFADPNPFSVAHYTGPTVQRDSYEERQVAESTIDLQPTTVALSGEIEGVAADGITSIVVRWPVAGPGTASLSLADELGGLSAVGKIGPLGAAPTTTQIKGIEAVQVDDAWYVFANYKPPLNFDRSVADNTLFFRPVSVSAAFTTAQSPVIEYRSTRSLKLIRPPLLFLHGLWGSAESWNLALQRDQRFITYAADYNTTVDQGIEKNVAHIAKDAAIARRNAHLQGFAASQVTVIAHSMGGLISRLHASNFETRYYDKENLGQGDFYKLITLYSPHQGSPVACAFETISSWGADIRELFTDRPLNSQSVRDLKPNSEAINNLPAIGIPVHVIAGTGGDEAVALIRNASSLCSRAEKRICSLINRIARLVTNFYDVSGMSPEHDLAVKRESALGGLTGLASTEVGFALNTSYPFIPLGTHFVGEQNQIGDDVLMPLLFAAVDSD
ncbi:MAG: alpha/beta fold hydrolase, partial [Bdellovibrionales bacterium]|nr:alpha/beta fold hydrolase [Bdellovibrionales bacterium]